MCGIAGIVSANINENINLELIEKMTNSLVHRGPDGYGIFHDRGVSFGHRRLSIIDIDGGHQPMSSEDQNVTVTYNGEIYNFQKIRKELQGLGCQFKTRSDTEVILHCYQKWGIESVKRFNGMFAFALWDSYKRRLYLVRDRMGVKPLYWTKINNKLVFASELKAILLNPEFNREVNLNALSSYLTFRQAVGEMTFFNGVKKLMPGHYMIYENGNISIKKYYELPIRENNEDLGEDYYMEGVEDLLNNSIKNRMISDVPLGAFLSGGLDSSILVALMSQMSKHKIKTFSIGYQDNDYNEAEFAHLVSKYCNTNHTEILITHNDYLDQWQELIEHRDTPLSIPHEVPLYQMSKILKKDITVVLSGEGADELFGGYGRVQRSPMDWKKIAFFRKLLSPLISDKISKYSQNNSLASLLSIDSHIKHFFHIYNWVPFHEKLDLFTKEVNHILLEDKITIDTFSKTFKKTEHIDPYDQILHVFQKIHLSCLLERLDMMTMATSVEARVPFVDDHELLEFVIHMPFHYKIKWNSKLSKIRALFYSSFKVSEWLDTNKYLLRMLGAKVLPSKIAFRKKLGFPTPLDNWFETGMINLAKDILLDNMTQRRGIFDIKKLEQYLINKQNIPYDFYGKKIWMLMNIELWFRKFFPSNYKAY